MAHQHEPAQQVADLRLQLFPVLSSARTDAPGRTRLIETPATSVVDSVSCGPFYVQCDCACK